ncbi:MAG: FecR domain-containing protein [Alphaproteobacteria bacterium]
MRLGGKLFIAAIVSGLLPTFVAAAQPERIGQLRSVSGEAFVVRGDARQPAIVGNTVQQKDIIETGQDGAVGITFDDNSVFSTGPNSNVSLEEFKYNPSTLKGSFLAKLGKGTLSVISGDIARGSPEAMKIRTPSAILGVRGTRFLVRVDEQ